MTWPLAEHTVSRQLVRTLLNRQFPELASLPLRRAGEGFDNVQWRLGNELVVRLPRRGAAVVLLENELRWLSVVTRNVHLETPAPLLEGRPDELFAWPWAIAHWVSGRPGDGVALATRSHNVERFVTFLRDLHQPAPSLAPQNPLRGGPLASRDAAFHDRIHVLGGDQGAWRKLWRWSTTAPPEPRAVWLHGDLHPGNLIFRHDQLVGVIDFGDLCAGDPATDLAMLALLAPFRATTIAFELYGASDDQRRRAIGWASLLSAMFLTLGHEGHQRYRRLGELGRVNVAKWGALAGFEVA